MSRTDSPSCNKPYGLVQVCKVWGFPRSTFYRQRSASGKPPKRTGPKGFHSDEELLVHIRQVILESPFTGEGYRKVWAQLRFRGIRTSKERTLRIMRKIVCRLSNAWDASMAPRRMTARSRLSRWTKCGERI
jgi:hypothetical protein